MDKFEEKKVTEKKMLPRNTWCNWHDWLINYIPKSTRNSELGKRQVYDYFFFKKNITIGYSIPKRVKNVYDGGRKPRK